MNAQACPCGTGKIYQACCEPIHAKGAGLGQTAEQLMRARYTAYVRADDDFLLQSWHEDTRPAEITFDDDLAWVGLEIVACDAGSGFDTTGIVEYQARYVRNGQPLELHEISSFVRVDHSWRYVDGR